MQDVMEKDKKRMFGTYKEIYEPEKTKDEAIKDALIELIKGIDFNVAVPDWATLQIIYHDRLYRGPLEDAKPLGIDTIAIKYREQ